jgi:S-adenosylhomocysteine hydrolase
MPRGSHSFIFQLKIVYPRGYGVPIIHNELRDTAKHFIGAVEQTANGIWRDRDEKLTPRPYLFPIINVAESKIKAVLESPLIGKAVCRNIEYLIGKEFIEIGGKEVGLVGYGRTGSKIASILKAMGAKVKVYSDDKIDAAYAKSEGHTVVDNAKDLVKNSRIIIEATGGIWAEEDEIRAFEHGSYLVSASSKQMGIDYNKFGRLTKSGSTTHITGIGTRYELQTGNNVTLLADGYPINFFDSESVPDKAIDFIPALLYKSAEFIVDKQIAGSVIPNDIINTNNTDFKELKNIEQEIAGIYMGYMK